MDYFSCSNDDHLFQQTRRTRHLVFGVYPPSRVVQASIVKNITMIMILVFLQTGRIQNKNSNHSKTRNVWRQELYYNYCIFRFWKHPHCNSKKVKIQSIVMNVMREYKRTAIYQAMTYIMSIICLLQHVRVKIALVIGLGYDFVVFMFLKSEKNVEF